MTDKPMPYRGFSNGTEYYAFLERQCDVCKHFVHWEDASPDSPVCPIEERMALTVVTGEDFPSEFIVEDPGPRQFPYCIKFEAVDKEDEQ